MYTYENRNSQNRRAHYLTEHTSKKQASDRLTDQHNWSHRSMCYSHRSKNNLQFTSFSSRGMLNRFMNFLLDAVRSCTSASVLTTERCRGKMGYYIKYIVEMCSPLKDAEGKMGYYIKYIVEMCSPLKDAEGKWVTILNILWRCAHHWKMQRENGLLY